MAAHSINEREVAGKSVRRRPGLLICSQMPLAGHEGKVPGLLAQQAGTGRHAGVQVTFVAGHPLLCRSEPFGHVAETGKVAIGPGQEHGA